MKKIIWLSLIATCIYCQAFGQDSQQITPYPTLFGTTGAILTPDARTIGLFKGTIGVYENLKSNFEDNLLFAFGVHDRVEVGLQSGIPSHPDADLGFFFKVKGNHQGQYFNVKNKFVPATAFGINRNSAFAVATYQLKKVIGSVGYNFSDHRKTVFGNLSYYPVRFVGLQSEYLRNTVGIGLRLNYKGLVAGFIYSHNLRESGFNTSNAYWQIAYHFNSFPAQALPANK